jgi:toluene monooxygenase electron transfer component
MQVTVTIKDVEYHFTAEPSERLLYAGLRQGVPLAYECATGTCGTCKATCVKGRINHTWPESPGLQERDRALGVSLLCQSTAESDCKFVGSLAPVNRASAQAQPKYFESRITEMTHLTVDVMLLTLSLGALIQFEPGQFALIGVNGIPGFRAYSMVEGLPTSRPSFIIKRKPGGAMSDWMFERAKVGTALQLFGPLGVATLQPTSDGDLFFLAGASGISMAFSILDAAARNGHLTRHRAEVIFGVRRASDLFLVDRLLATGATVTLALSDEVDIETLQGRFPNAYVTSGFVHEAAALHLPPATSETIAFLAGPPPMIDACLRHLIAKARIPPTRIRYDKFS